MTTQTESLSSSDALISGFELPKGLLYLIEMDIPFGVYERKQKRLLGPTTILDLTIKRALQELQLPMDKPYQITFSNRDKTVWLTTHFNWQNSEHPPLRINATLDTPETSCPIFFKKHTIGILKSKSNYGIEPYSLINQLKRLLMFPGVFINIEDTVSQLRVEIELNSDWSIFDIAARGLTL